MNVSTMVIHAVDGDGIHGDSVLHSFSDRVELLRLSLSLTKVNLLQRRVS